MESEINTVRYPRADISQADGVAWVLTSANEPLVKYPFKFYPLGPNDVRLKVLYTSICQSDILDGRSKWGPAKYPLCPGHEIVGQITMIGTAVTLRKVGDRVGISPVRKSCFNCQNCESGSTNMCDERIYLYQPDYFGGYATHMQIDENWAIPFPKDLSIQKSAPILCAGLTVYAPLKKHLRINGKCAVIGIGGLGHLGVQYANKLGMTVTAFTTRPQRKNELNAMGAQQIEHSINLQQLKKNQGKYDVVLNTLFVDNQQVYKAHQRLTAPGGVYITVGVPSEKTRLAIDFDYLIKNQIKIVGSNVASIIDAVDTLQFSAEHNVVPIVQEYSFEDMNKAYNRAQFEAPKFRCVINVHQWAKNNGFDK